MESNSEFRREHCHKNEKQYETEFTFIITGAAMKHGGTGHSQRKMTIPLPLFFTRRSLTPDCIASPNARKTGDGILQANIGPSIFLYRILHSGIRRIQCFGRSTNPIC